MEVSAPDDGMEYAAVMMRLLGPRGVVLLDKYRGHDEVRRLYEALVDDLGAVQGRSGGTSSSMGMP